VVKQGFQARILPEGFATWKPKTSVAFKENLNPGIADRLMKGWMDSPRHKRNILGGFSQIGVGCAIDEDGKHYWCVTFGLPLRR